MELDDAPRHTRDAWTRDNNLGLRWASEGRWFEAADAFARAVALSTSDIHEEPTPFATVDLDHEEALAVLLTNLSQAQFEVGHLTEALESAERACAIRTSLMGENAPAVARSRSQVAVMLGFMGRLDEAQALIGQAIASLESQLSDDDEQLAPFLENAARLALAAGQPAAAEPHLIRLHAVLAENGHSLEVVEELLSHIAASRAAQAKRASEEQRIEREPEQELAQEPESTEMAPEMEEVPQLHHDVVPQSALFEPEEIDASFGRSFAGVSGSHESVNVFDSITLPLELEEHAAVGDLEVLDLQLELDEAKLMATAAPFAAPATPSPESDAPNATANSEDIFGGASFDLVEPPPPTLNALPQLGTGTPSRANPLGFEVEYGVPQQPYEPTGLARPEGDVEPAPAQTEELIAEGLIAETPIRNDEARVSPLDQPTPLVMPGRNESQRAPNGASNQDSSSLRLMLHPADVDNRDADSRRQRRARTGRTVVADPKKPWLIAVAIVLVGAAAGLLFSGILSRS